MIVLHCSATREDKRYTAEDCRRDHVLNNKWQDMGYHYYIELDGTLKNGRPESVEGAHCKCHNRHSIGICLEGGLDRDGQFADTRTDRQRATLKELLGRLKTVYPKALIVAHHELNPSKYCPCFDVSEYRQMFG